jgi:hypothetical protein
MIYYGGRRVMIGVCDFNPSFFSHFCILYRVLVGRESTPADMDGSSGQKTGENKLF